MDTGTTRHDVEWLLALFASALGIGILYLPIQVGPAGIWPFLLLACVCFPLIWQSRNILTHLLLARGAQIDIAKIVGQDLNEGAGMLVRLLGMLLYLGLAIACATGMINIASTFVENQLGLESIPRPVLGLLLALGLSAVMLASGEKVILRISAMAVYPLIAILIVLTAYLVPAWHLSALPHFPAMREWGKDLLLLFPLMIFSMDSSARCALLAQSYGRIYPDTRLAMRRSRRPLCWSSLLLLFFVLIFVSSCLLAMQQQDLAYARLHNIDILTLLSLHLHSSALRLICPLLAFAILLHGYFSVFVTARRELAGMLTFFRPHTDQHHEWASTLLLALPLWLPTLADPSILLIIGLLATPVMALQSYVIPPWLMLRLPALAPYRQRSGKLILAAGLLLCFSYAAGYCT
jgi:serine transporter